MHTYTTAPALHLHTHTPTHALTCTPIHLHTHTPTHPYTYTPIHLHTPTPTHPYTYTCTHLHCVSRILICNIAGEGLGDRGVIGVPPTLVTLPGCTVSKQPSCLNSNSHVCQYKSHSLVLRRGRFIRDNGFISLPIIASSHLHLQSTLSYTQTTTPTCYTDLHLCLPLLPPPPSKKLSKLLLNIYVHQKHSTFRAVGMEIKPVRLMDGGVAKLVGVGA